MISAPAAAAPWVIVDMSLTSETEYFSGCELSQRMNGVASQYVCWQKTTRRMTKAYVRQEPRTRLKRDLLSPVDGLKPSSASRFLASAFSSSERKRDLVRSGMSGNMKKPLIH